MKLLILFFALALSSFGQVTQHMLGLPVPTVLTLTTNINAAANWLAFGFQPDAACTVNKVSAYIVSVTGTLSASGDVTLDLCSDSSGSPGTCASPIESKNVTTATPAVGRVEWAGFTTALTALTQYWFVIRNTNGSPASNTATFRYFQNYQLFPSGASSGFSVKTSTNSGSAWTNVTNSTPSLMVECSGSVFYGMLASTTTANAVTNARIFSDHEHAAVFTTAANASPNISDVAFFATKTSSPTGSLRVKIYSDNGTTLTLLGTSDTLLAPASVDANARWLRFHFNTAVPLPPSTKIRVALSETTQSDTSANYYNASTFTFVNEANPLTLTPFAGTLRGGYCSSSCATVANWTETSDPPIFAVMLNPTTPYASVGGGSSQRGWVY